MLQGSGRLDVIAMRKKTEDQMTESSMEDRHMPVTRPLRDFFLRMEISFMLSLKGINEIT